MSENSNPIRYKHPSGKSQNIVSNNPVPYNPNNVAYYPPRIRRASNPFTRSFVIATLVAAAFLGAEKYAPAEFKPSHMVGSYEANIDSQVADAVKGTETYYLGQIEEYKSEVATYVEAQNSSVRARNEAILQYYTAIYQRAQVLTQGLVNIQNTFATKMMQIAETLSSTDLGVSSGANALGHILNAIEPGSGDGLTNYTNESQRMAETRLKNALQSAMSANVIDLNQYLPSPDEVMSDLESIELPEPPKFPNIRPYSETHPIGGRHE